MGHIRQTLEAVRNERHLLWRLQHLRLRSPLLMRRGEWVTSQQLIDGSRTFVRCCRSLAKRLDIRFADAGDWDIPVTYDGVHFTEQGHRAFAVGLLEVLK